MPGSRDAAKGARVFCFPHAGAGGSSLYRGWGANLCPAVPPGREGRYLEPPIDRMEALIAALEPAIAPLLDRPFAFFGHSMGAGVAFELTRALRRSGRSPAARRSSFRLRALRICERPCPRNVRTLG